MADPEDQAREIFHAALSLSDDANRGEYLAVACKGDDKLRAHVDSLLATLDQAGDFMEVAAIPTQSLAESEQASNSIDRYKLLQKIGEGGFGVVYMAEQLEPIHRRVALKVIKAGMDTKQVIARFEAERQALALMNHPHIARVLDAGETEQGRPYFAMELVHGVPVTEYCDDESLSTEKRLRLFVEICAAVQHAHQKGIIHRDIKPGNVLVYSDGDRPVPKIIDFGIAKATQGRLTDKTLFTQFRQFIGTPTYMSPEQARMSGGDIDTRSDIYSLGVLLYELLTGETPLDADSLVHAGYEEICRRIREEEALKPSKQLSSLQADELTTRAKQRRVAAVQFASSVRGDLDWIVMKAVEKDRARRYESCGALAADVDRYLKDEPVAAGPPSAVYHLRKFLRRNRTASLAVVGIAASLLLGAIVASMGWLRAVDTNEKLSAQFSATQHALTVANQETKRATRAEFQARTAQAAAEKERRTAVKTAYLADMVAAHQALKLCNFGVARRILERNREFAPDFDPRNWEWRALWLLCQGEAENRFGSSAQPVVSLDVAPNTKYVVSGGNSVCVWNVMTGEIEHTLIEETAGDAFYVTYSHDGQRIFAGDKQGRIWCWDCQSYEAIHTDMSHDRQIYGIAIAPNGKWLVTLAGYKSPNRNDIQVIAWDLATGKPRKRPIDLEGGPGSLAISNDSSTLVLGLGKELRILDLESLEETHTIKGSGRSAVAISPDGQYVACATGLTVPEFFVHRVSDGERVAHLTGHLHATNGLAYSPDGRLIASANVDQTVRLWDTTTYSEVSKLIGHEGPVRDLTFSDDSKKLVSSDAKGSICVWNTTPDSLPHWPVSRQRACLYGGPGGWYGQLSQVSYSYDGNRLATTTNNGWEEKDRGVLIRSPKNLEVERILHKTSAMKRGVRFSPVSELLTIGDVEGSLSFINTAEPSSVMQVAVSEAGAVIFPCRFTPDGKRLLVIARSDTTTCHVFSVEERQPISSWEMPNAVNCCAISPDGLVVVSGHPDGVRVWDLANLESPQHVASINCTSVDISPDGKMLVASQLSDGIYIIDLQTLKQIDTLTGHANRIGAVRFSPDGRRLASGGDGHADALKLWDFETRREILTLNVEGWSNRQIEWTHDGNSILMMGGNARVSIWRVPSFEEISEFERRQE